MNHLKIINSIHEIHPCHLENGCIIPFSFYKNEFIFLFGRESKEIKTENKGLWKEFNSKNNKTLDDIIKEFWQQTNGFFNSPQIIKEYIESNSQNLLIIFSPSYNGTIIFIPIKYCENIEKYFNNTYQFIKHILDNKKEIIKCKKRGLLSKDNIQWFNINDFNKLSKKFTKSSKDILNIINDFFQPNIDIITDTQIPPYSQYVT